MKVAPRPSPVRRIAAVTLANIAGVAIVLLLLWITETSTAPPPKESTGYLPFAFFFPIGLMIGSVIGIPLCLLIGIPLWHLALLCGWHRRREAAGCGAVAGAIIAILLTLLPGEQTIVVSWNDAPLFVGTFVAAGAFAGLVARRIAYPD